MGFSEQAMAAVVDTIVDILAHMSADERAAYEIWLGCAACPMLSDCDFGQQYGELFAAPSAGAPAPAVPAVPAPQK